MPLEGGTRLGPSEILSPLGPGGTLVRDHKNAAIWMATSP
jgi:hypothetical protein